MNKTGTPALARVRFVRLILALLILLSGLASAQAGAVTPLVVQLAKLRTSDGAELDQFGSAVAVSLDTVVASAPYDDDNGINSGSVYVFEKASEGGWSSTPERAKLTASDGAQSDLFGLFVSIHGETVVVGAVYEDDKGSVYLFEMPETGWADTTETAKLTASDRADGDNFGTVSISGETVVVGASWDDDDGSGSGSAYVFEKPTGGWTDMTETAKLTASDAAAADWFGRSVSISGDTVIVGAPGHDDSGECSGAAYLFQRDAGGPGNWGQVAKLTASDGAEYDNFGTSVTISGDTVVVGAPDDDDSGIYSGSAYVFEKPESGWTNMTETAKLTASDGAANDEFGGSVSIDGDTVVIGTYEADISGATTGSAYLFVKPESAWTDMTETLKLLPRNGTAGGWFGRSVSISGDTVVIGAPWDDETGTDSGAVYVFGPPFLSYLPVVLCGAP